MNLRGNCLQCHKVWAKCHLLPNINLCTFCRKYIFPCVFLPSKHASTDPLPPPSLPCFLPLRIILSWMHQFAAMTNSSNWVRAASVVFLVENRNKFHKVRLLDQIQKKQAKQEMFLKMVNGLVGSGCQITMDEVNREVIVFANTMSYLPPPILPLSM